MDLKEYFESTGISQLFFSKKIKISKTALSQLVNKKAFPTLKTAWEVEKATEGKVRVYDWLMQIEPDLSSYEWIKRFDIHNS